MIRTRRAALAQSLQRFSIATNAERVCAEIMRKHKIEVPPLPSLPRPAAFGKDGPPGFGRTTTQASKLERFVALRPRGPKPGAFQRSCREDFPGDSVVRALCVFAHDLK